MPPKYVFSHWQSLSFLSPDESADTYLRAWKSNDCNLSTPTRPRCISMCPLEVLPSPTSAVRCSWTICCIIWVHQKYWLPTLFCQPKKIECVCLTLIVPVNCDPLHITLFDCRSPFPLSREHGGSLRSQVIQTQHKRLMHLWWTCLSGFGVLFAGMILDVWWQVSLRDHSVCLCLSVF